MLNRLLGIATTVLMVAANGQLLSRDVLPYWLASDPPPMQALQIQPGEEHMTQAGIYDGEGRRLGTAWTLSERRGDVITRHALTVLRERRLSAGISIPRVRIDTTLTYLDENHLDEIVVRVHGFEHPVELRGIHVQPNQFPIEWRVGDQEGTLVIPAAGMRAVSDALRPFDGMTDLSVGQSWRVQLLDPLVLTGDGESRTRSILVKVTGSETIRRGQREIEAFVLEAAGARAWVAPDGEVLRQEVTLPLYGTLTLLAEPPDPDRRRRWLHEPFEESE